jgi:transketolase
MDTIELKQISRNDRLKQKSRELRLKVLDIAYKTGKGHIGSSFSVMDILVTLYYTELFDAKVDVIMMGKGHACLPVYCILNEFGYISNECLNEYGTSGGRLGLQFDTSIPTIKYNTGSLGHVFGIGVGLRVTNKYRNVYTIVGDGECEEGSMWETADFAARISVGPMLLIVDRNRLSIIQKIDNDRLEEKFKAFGLDCVVVDGHNHSDVYDKLLIGINSTKPLVVIADTVKGKGVSFMENDTKWHTGVLNQEQYLQARTELQNGY